MSQSTAPTDRHDFLVDGMDCADCATRIERTVARMPGVANVSVSVLGGQMQVELDGGSASPSAVRERVVGLGYGVTDATPGPSAAPAAPVAPDSPGRRLLRHWTRGSGTLTAVASVLLTIAVIADLLVPGVPHGVVVGLYLLPVLVGGLSITRAGIRGTIATRGPDMNLLMTIAVVGAVAIGAWMEAALVVVLFSVGETLERRAVGRARRELASLVTLTPENACVLTAEVDADGTVHERETVQPVAALRIDDRVVVRPGERVPTDGTIVEGSSTIDQAAITGESVPVDRSVDDAVFAGTINGQGRLVVRTTSAPGDTTLDRIGRLVAEAQAQRSPSERWVTAFARIYTPIVIVIALAVAVLPAAVGVMDFADSFYAALALLILACPCALVLSTPVSIVSALGRASAAGVLIKGGAHLERAATIRTVAFDKTGTLTAGTPRVTHVEPLSGTADELLRLAAAVEHGSAHPLAVAIVAAAQALPDAPRWTVEDAQSLTGLGASATVDGDAVRVGGPRMFAPAPVAVGATGSDDAAAPDPVGATGADGAGEAWTDRPRVIDVDHPGADVDALVARLQSAGSTVVLVERAGRVVGGIGLADQPRPEAREAIEQLRRLGITETVMLTGDHAATAQAIADELGVRTVRADLMPADKAEAVATLPGPLAMVGDGVNDAPALARADLGLAMGTAGSDAAIEVADVALLGDDPRKVAGLIGLARWTRAIVRQNIAFSLGTKLVAAVFLLFGMLPLWAAVGVDVGASLIVVANGLRIVRQRPRGSARALPLLGESTPVAS